VFYDGATDANAGTVCYNGDGSHHWGPIHYSYLQGDGYDYAQALAIEPDNIGKAVHVFVTGFADRGAITGHDYLTLRYPGVNALTHDYVNFYNTSGSVVDWSHDVSVTGNGSVYVTGQSGDDIATLRYDKQLVQQAVIRYTPGSTAEGRGIANTCAGKAHVAGLANNSGHYFDCETMIDQLSTSNFVPNSLTIEAGQNVVGNLSSVQASDDNRLTVEPGAVFFGYPVRVIVEGHSPLSSPNELCFELEASGSDLHLEQRVELYDWVSGSWAQMDLRGVTTADSVVYCAVPYDSTRFVQAITGTVKARVSFQQTGAVFTYPWTGKIDYCAWHVLN
jgi:hypothetical protein